MLQKIAKIITNNFGLKVLAVVVAVIFWLVIVNVEDPEKTQVFTIPVTIENEDYLTDMGKTYEVLNHSDTITFTVSAQRSVLERVTEDDFIAVADMRDIVNMSEIPVVISAQKYANQLSIANRTQYVEIKAENIVSKDFDVQLILDGSMPSGYSMSSNTLSPETVTVSGPESVVDSIKTAAVHVNAKDLTGNRQVQETIKLYDSSENIVSQKHLTLSSHSVLVSMDVLQQKTVPVKYETEGTPEDGYYLEKVSGNVSRIKIEGTPKTLKKVNEITVDGKALDISGLKKSTTVSVDLSDYLPDGVTLAEGESKQAKVVLTIEGRISKEFEIPASNIELQNIPEGYNAVLKDSSVKVTLEGYSEELDQINASDLKGKADLSGQTQEGTVEVPLKLDGNYTVSEEVKVTVELSAVEQPADPENPTEEPSGDEEQEPQQTG